MPIMNTNQSYHRNFALSPSPLSSSSEGSEQGLASQLAHLCLLHGAANEACKAMRDVKYASPDHGWDESLTEFQKWLCVLALISHTERGGNTITSLVCLLGLNGTAEILFTSNLRKEGELESIKKFLEELLGYVATNPDKLNPKALEKQILWRIIEANFRKVNDYLVTLLDALEECIKHFRHPAIVGDVGSVEKLQELKKKATFPRDITLPGARNKYLKDCEVFMKAIEQGRNRPLEDLINSRASQENPESSYHWRELRHCLGRLNSYRQAASIVFKAPTKWPDLFKSFRIAYIPSPKQKSIPSPKSSDLTTMLNKAFPDMDPADLQDDITELQSFGFQQHLSDQIKKRDLRAVVHGEVNMHHYLVKNRKTKRSDFWEDRVFIASSKPTCMLCHYYFQYSDNNFIVRSPHMNLYPKWRFPDGCEEEVMEETIEQMQVHTLEMLKTKLPQYRNNDSRTDSHAGTASAMSGGRRVGFRPGNESNFNGYRGFHTPNIAVGISEPDRPMNLGQSEEVEDFDPVDDFNARYNGGRHGNTN